MTKKTMPSHMLSGYGSFVVLLLSFVVRCLMLALVVPIVVMMAAFS